VLLFSLGGESCRAKWTASCQQALGHFFSWVLTVFSFQLKQRNLPGRKTRYASIICLKAMQYSQIPAAENPPSLGYGLEFKLSRRDTCSQSWVNTKPSRPAGQLALLQNGVIQFGEVCTTIGIKELESSYLMIFSQSGLLESFLPNVGCLSFRCPPVRYLRTEAAP
jgi:hypothetical protein